MISKFSKEVSSKYLRNWISDDEYATKDIQARIAIGKTLFMDKKKIVNKEIAL